MREEVKNWWKQAEYDLGTAKANYGLKRYSVVMFLCQQSIEKGLKALWLERFNKAPKVHDLKFLAKKLDLPEEFLESCKDLTNVYVETRYPDAALNPANKFSDEEASNYLKKSGEIIKWIEKAL